MPIVNLKPSHKPVREYYKELKQFEKLGVSHEGAVKTAFQKLLESCEKQFSWTLVQEWQIKRPGKRAARVDGALVDDFGLTHGYWEAKDSDDDLAREVKKKFQDGYPKDNIIFQAPERVILYQDGKQVEDVDITQPETLVDILQRFFNYRPPAYEQWEKASEDFKRRVPELGAGLQKLIAEQRKTNRRFIEAFADFTLLCKQAINPNLSESAIEEMLIQHLLTERVFRTVFNNPDFTRRNVIAVEIEKVIDALTSKAFNRQAFLQNLDYFYRAVEETAATISDFSQKQTFLNAIYEKFFQGFSVKVADTHGIVYTPQPIVNFMVKSVEDILQREFGKSLSDKGVHILDPFVGTGNFIVRVMREIRKTALPYKYEHELHCNEVMLLPYYIASMNIEHEYLELAGSYQPFEGICFVDTFELVEERQLSLFTPENTARVERQRQSPIFVIIGNPPYNTAQVNENDNNKNRKYYEIDRRIYQSYAKTSNSTNVNKLNDPYVKAIRWASDRIDRNGIIALVTNNSFIDDFSFDGVRKSLLKDFHRIYTLDLKGNVRRDSMREGIPIGEKHTVFGLAAMVGIAITFLIKREDFKNSKIFYSAVDWKNTRNEKFELIEKAQCFPFYTYDEDGTNRRENITDWALEQFRTQYQDKAISEASAQRAIAKWDIFHYVYAVLHHQQYRDRYAANLKRELPRIPFAPDFWAFVNAGKRLAEIHVNYEQQPEYPLQWIENSDMPLDWRVEKMKLTKDKTQLIYNDFLTLSNIPPQSFNYRLGNRSALDWIIDQYQFKTDERSGITNDPNRLDDEQYIVRLIGQVITVSLETVEIVNALPSLGIPEL